MNQSTTQPHDAQARARRLHLSTYVVVTLNTLVILVLQTPGEGVVAPEIFAQGKYGPHFNAGEIRWDHGWPMTYVSRKPVYVNGSVYRPGRWNVFQGVEQFAVAGLLADVAVSILILFVAGWLFERWRRRRRNVLQLHLIDLFLFATIIAACLGFFAFRRSQHRHDLEVLRLIDEIPQKDVHWGESVHQRIDWQRGGPSWLRDYVGDLIFEAFDRIAGIEVTGEELEHAVELRDLKVVRILGAISNRQLKLLEQCQQLEALDMGGAHFDSEGEELIDDDGNDVRQYFCLPRLPNLRGINLYETDFRGDGLRNLPAVELLDLTDTDIDDAHLAELESLRHVKDLSISSRRMTNVGLRHIGTLPELEKLYLRGDFNNQGVTSLANLTKLRELQVESDKNTDDSIPILKRFSKLEYLNLHGTAITADAEGDLQKALPNCDIRR